MNRLRVSGERRGRRRKNEEQANTDESSLNPELWVYRDRTKAMLLRYFHMSVEVGRLPSILGREFFRAQVTSYRVNTFEEAVIFVHDVEKSLQELDRFSQQLIARVVLQEYTQEEAARLLGCARKTVSRCLPVALDRLSEIFLAKGMLHEWETTLRRCRKPCQGAGRASGEARCCSGGV